MNSIHGSNLLLTRQFSLASIPQFATECEKGLPETEQLNRKNSMRKTQLYIPVVTSVFVASASLLAQTTPLETKVLGAMLNQHFEQVIDYGPYAESCPGKSFCSYPANPTPRMPNVDVAVIQLDANGQMVDRANVMLSRDYPAGLVVPLDPNGGATSVRFRRWDIARYDGGTFSSKNGGQLTVKGWTNNPALTDADDIVPGRQSAPYQFMAPYPASCFKLMIGFKVMRMVDAGIITLDTLYSPDGKKSNEKKIRDWMDAMITYSHNASAQAMVKLLHDRGQMTVMHQEFRDWGLGTLQVNGTSTSTGGVWSPGQIHMTAYDAARLLWIIEGGTGTFWIGANGQPVTAALLSASSRSYLKGLLADQGFNDTLTSANMCGNVNRRPGIPCAVPSRWIAADGTVTVDGYAYGMNVLPCNASAEVAFAHKTGFTFNYCSDMGIVNSLPGQPSRRYIVVYLSNLGYRYADEVFATATSLPYYMTTPIPYTQRAAALGKAIDDGLKP